MSASEHPFWPRLHLALAMVSLCCLPLATAPKDIAFAILLVYTIVRLPRTWRSYQPLLVDRLGWLLIAWMGWQALTVTWSSDADLGWAELRAFRMLLTGLLLWPVMRSLPWLVGAFLIGVATQNAVQLAQHLEWFGLRPDDNTQRLGGLVHPIATATLCTAAMAWHLTAALIGNRVQRGIAVAGLLAAGVGLVFTGSRGPWLVAAVVVPVQLLTLAIRVPRVRRNVLWIGLISVVVGAGFWPFGGAMVRERAAQTWLDLQQAQQDDFEGDVGNRLASWAAAWDLFQDHPWAGVGAGGFREEAAAGPWGETLPDANHAHCTYLHTLATTGGIGALLLLGVVVIAVARAARDRDDHLYARGNLFVLLAWLGGAAFDVYHLSGQMFGLMALVMAITVPYRPHVGVTSPESPAPGATP